MTSGCAASLARLAHQVTPEIGSRLASYQILAPLGAGGMGEVYRARDTTLGREVAVKVRTGAQHLTDADRGCHAPRRDPRYRRVHEPRAGEGRERRPARRHLGLRRLLVRSADRGLAIPGSRRHEHSGGRPAGPARPRAPCPPRPRLRCALCSISASPRSRPNGCTTWLTRASYSSGESRQTPTSHRLGEAVATCWSAPSRRPWR